MRENRQGTAATMRESMLHRYDDGLQHKHNKCHLAYRQHWPSHPAYIVEVANSHDQAKEINESTGGIRKQKLEKIRKKRFDKRNIH